MEVYEREMKVKQQERLERMERKRWNKWYKEVRTVELPRYVKGKEKEGRMIRIVMFRLSNEIREGKYWKEEEGRK